ncbi:GNAT family N-acetyltransferase [Corallococcus exiguus]|uniref:GNAT family N-acetyltransferase n=1 Tax=Corallococcus exiguus TaxID=83462 RepID=UPI001A8EBADD|nr:GNAT family N-acetyltransferase [Corallococcus exiguus]MBN8469444.1 GNAT family N-acetyltransferase [Corallococcus exiguus]
MMEPATRLVRAIEEAGYQLFIHPAIKLDVERDRDEARRWLRELLLGKYLPLPAPPPVPTSWDEVLGSPELHSNDWVDHQLLAAVRSNAVGVLVTEDLRIHRKAKRVGLKERVVTVGEALSMVQGLRARFARPPPAVEFTFAHDVDAEDPFLDSLRGDYPSFDGWFRRCQMEHRRCWVVRGQGRHLAALCLIKDEEGVLDLKGRTLKLCTFKVAPAHQARRLGELLLKSVFEHVSKNGHDFVYVTAYERQGALIAMFEDFGFQVEGRTESGELVLLKRMRAGDAPEVLSPLDFHVRHGPPSMKFDVPSFIIPIEPRFHHLLFPDADSQLSLEPGIHPFGNGLRKAYLCRALNRQIEPGASLLFYLSHSQKAVTVVGIAEQTLVSADAEEIAATVGKRTVFSLRDMQTLCSNGEVLAILFRQAAILKEPIPLSDLCRHGVLNGPPQSITTVQPGGREWLRQRLGL